VDIWIPKYKDIIVGNDLPTIQNRFKGEWRAKLVGPDGMVKYQSDWKPNLITGYGLSLTVRQGITGVWSSSALGDSNAAVDKTQTSLQGTELGDVGRTNITGGQTNEGPPNYGMVDRVKFVYAAGNGTGTIREMVLYKAYTSPQTGVTARWLIEPEIVKGASDELTVEHRLTFYPDLSQHTGTFSISGVAYNYWLQCDKVNTTTYRPDNVVPAGGTTNVNFSLTLMDDQVSDPSTLYPTHPNAWTGYSDFSTCPNPVYTYGTVIANDEYYSNTETIFGVDAANGDKDFARHAIVYLGLGVGYIFRKVSDGTPLTKENTHELRMNLRASSLRYP
jgi:hypothetical protein